MNNFLEEAERVVLNRTVRELSVLRPWTAARAIAFQWLVIAGSIAVALWFRHPAAYALAVLVIATRQHALAILVHEGAHYRLFRSRRLNNLVSDLLIGFPVGVSTSLYRSTHLRHHSHLGTDQDPDAQLMAKSPEWTWPKTPWQAAKLFVCDFLLLNRGLINAAIQWMPWPALFRNGATPLGPNPLPPKEKALVIAWTLVIAAGVALVGGWLEVLLLWIVPLIAVMPALFRVRALGEHVGVERTHDLNSSRHVEVGPLERFLFAPLNTNYHLAHHLFPSVPFYNLPKMQESLEAIPEFCEQATSSNGYIAPGHSERTVLADLLAKHS